MDKIVQAFEKITHIANQHTSIIENRHETLKSMGVMDEVTDIICDLNSIIDFTHVNSNNIEEILENIIDDDYDNIQHVINDSSKETSTRFFALIIYTLHFHKFLFSKRYFDSMNHNVHTAFWEQVHNYAERIKQRRLSARIQQAMK